jgi:alpha-L-rhamnosidase
MRTTCALILLMAASAAGLAAGPAKVWPEATQTARPWTRWWWPASAVERTELTRELEALAAAGIGGVEITPIYGARGSEDRALEFLSPRWMEMLGHTAAEAKRFGLGVDMATGTGWPFGGPEVSIAQGSSTVVLENGRLTGQPTGMKVKRAAPGGEGLVLDPYAVNALDAYLERFTRALAALPRGAVRGQFHDSFEYYQASWTPQFAAEFARLHDYDVQVYAAEFVGQGRLDADTAGRVAGDYRRTLARLHLDYVNRWVDWSHAHGFIARNQAHGAPGNLLDLYAAADIPETESFGFTELPVEGLRVETGYARPDPDPPLGLVGRFASSAGHVAGRRLVSSETLTWLRENFRESPAAAKPQLDRLFVAGINHIFYHGVSYSPSDAPWPGWYFYAATQLGPDNPLWQHFAAMNDYVARVQSVLQAGRPDNDVLLYWPFDELTDHGSGLMNQYGVHEIDWLMESSFAAVAQRLLSAGYALDFISDAQLAGLQVEAGQLLAPGGRYRLIVVPALQRMSPDTLARLGELQRRGATLVFENLPEDVPGFSRLDARRAELAKWLVDPALHAAVATQGLETKLAQLGVRREAAGPAGLGFIRRAQAEGFDYFFTNLTGNAFDGWLDLGVTAATAILLDPMTGEAGLAAINQRGTARVYLQLASGQSVILRTSGSRRPGRGVAAWRYVRPVSAVIPLAGEWQMEFIKGGPVLPGPARLRELRSWTTLEPEGQRFAGTARYRLEFDAPETRAEAWALELGDVREAARVSLNGKPLGAVWALPFTLRIDGRLKAHGNVLEIEVSNLPANRIRDLDLRKVDWKVMQDINLVSLSYAKFDASGWEMAPSGLLGPVRLRPLEVVSLR